MVTGIATFGTSDFINFLFGFFRRTNDLLVIRLYMDIINDFVTGAIEGFLTK